MRLRTKILLCAAANLILLGSAVIVFVRFQFRPDAESILLAPAEARLTKLGDQIAAELAKQPVAQWDATLARSARMYRVDMAVTGNSSGDTLAGTIKKVPDEVRAVLESRSHFPAMIWLNPGSQRPPRLECSYVVLDAPHSASAFIIPPAPEPAVFFKKPDRNREEYWFGVRINLQWPEANYVVPATLLVGSPSIFFRPLLFDARQWLICLGAIAGITLLCWIPLIRGLTRSIGKITVAAGQIAEGRFEVQTGVRRRDEVGQLDDAIHRMAVQLQGFVNGQRRFLGDISHELCTPIARTRVALGVLEERGESAQKRYIDSAVEEVEHMSGLVNELLQFSKAGLAPQETVVEPVVIGDLVARVIEREAVPGGDVRLMAGSDLRLLANPQGLFRALSNLVRNAVRYAGSDGPVLISAKLDGRDVLLSVADQGPGLPEEALDRVFTPFYRLDDSRSRESGGVGLGLAMVKSLVESSGGAVSCRNLSPHGLEVTIRLPAAR